MKSREEQRAEVLGLLPEMRERLELLTAAAVWSEHVTTSWGAELLGLSIVEMRALVKLHAAAHPFLTPEQMDRLSALAEGAPQ